ncbi:MAG: Mut7-C ubiquitin/RNAse domain-containing protein [Deltaproteobacteria bacterium]|nr:Mut7-C ubiquitin/RNAse domain-containing protein [Deltaproteobacteria bacterium]
MKVKTTFRFYEELNDFLPVHRKKVDFDVKFEGKRSINDIIESLGAPHTEIDLILVNGKSVDFHFPLRRTKFITDVHLGKIAKYMRVLGFDVYYNSLLSIREIIEISKKENRIILTTSRKLLKFKDVSHGIFIRPAATTKQIKRIIDYLDIKEIIEPFTRCLWCNTLLNIVLKEDILEKIPPKTREFCNEYVQCQSCDKIYWKGSHYIHMEKVIRTMLDNPES